MSGIKLIGAHVSAQGGVENAPLNAAEIKATAFALFTRNQRRWESPPLTQKNIELFKSRCRQNAFFPGAVLPHDSYLINLGSPEPEQLNRSREAFSNEMNRCFLLGLKFLNFHPGSHKGRLSDHECLKRIGESVNLAHQKVPAVTAVIENTAGMGSSMGYSFEQISELIGYIEKKNRVGVCLDTCHLFAAGYDLRTPESYEQTMRKFSVTVGENFLTGMHLNDSKGKLGSRLDRHQSLGKGEIGWQAFKSIIQDPRTDGIPLILETPDPNLWPAEIEKLKSFIII